MRDYIGILTTGSLSADARRRALSAFASDLGWLPSDPLDLVAPDEVSTAHLVVEHGLQNTAMISFLRTSYDEIGAADQRSLISLSYNNLVDWHLTIDRSRVRYVYNRVDPPEVVVDFPVTDQAALRSDAFERVMGRRPSPNVPPLDEALIRTVSLWKRSLFAEMKQAVGNVEISALFNAVIFCRAVEDYFTRVSRSLDVAGRESFGLNHAEGPLSGRVHSVLDHYKVLDALSDLVDLEQVRAFDDLESLTVEALVADFYRNRFARGYAYDFALMSKHALSRIYERYVSELRPTASPQQSFFADLPRESIDRATGNVYTPEFIARFFARFLREELSPRRFRQLRAVDHSCGSGIFLRTLLEFQVDVAFGAVDYDGVDAAFGGVKGIDIDPNACHAARLSLALLHLVVTGGRLPEALDVINAEALSYIREHQELREVFDLVLANPPFIAIERQEPALRDATQAVLGRLAQGRVDAYLAFLVAGLELVKPGGFGMFVVPHSFLIARAAAPVREFIANETWVRLVADLSGVRVFEDVGAYVALLIVQKKSRDLLPPDEPVVVRCQAWIGEALSLALRGQLCENSYYMVGRASRVDFGREPWVLRSPLEVRLARRLGAHPPLEEFLEVREGYNSGADSIFILDRSEVPAEGGPLFRPLLEDREMEAYRLPEEGRRVCFYPYLDGRLLSEEEVESDFPEVWRYLSRHRRSLEARAQVIKGNLEWWRPERPRPPERMLVPKIVTPHLVLLPKFSLDDEGSFVVRRSPVLLLKENLRGKGLDRDLLRYFVGILNSAPAFWLLGQLSHRFGGGYNMLEPKTLKPLTVPDPEQLEGMVRAKFVRLVREREVESGSRRFELERALNDLAFEFYGLGPEERDLVIGGGGGVEM